ncbi:MULTISPECIES: branched-chain amino acid ABC transporter permease [unclassified Marinobacter]|jgi:branched-chain amino acid transport system permease protein|uniref:Branched-chain amino acid ABC transporter permease n=1 Tax=Marinobacter nauticus TaxID=2743 RepID=A0A455W381_MARNT|nr:MULTISPECIES: branched-chain amino acid ABC transporter permease [unclassified Marinobacter]QFS86269.1 leucine/isoleucine/valine transporter permease subunit [Marinobacter sp. THAF197a]QFT50050.1 leucine/isoleucine/valine transporter permease subunit [Marinobacter sp. THAF39]BBJ03271.1 branched-chain amino acid ABC transporter permease [Marinobacter nauticus]
MSQSFNPADVRKAIIDQQKAQDRRKMLLNGVLLLLLLAAPFAMYPVFLMKILCFALFAVAFNLLFGFTGLLSFGHAAFLATGGYTTGYLLSNYSGLTTEVGIIAGTLVATALGLAFALLSIRRQGIYFAMVTLALAQLVYFFFVQSEFTGGEDGMHGIPRGHLFGLIDLSENLNMYYFVLAVFIGCYLLVQRIVSSPYGQVLKAIKQNEPRAVSLGYNVDRYKVLAFVISAALAGLAGSMKSVVFQLASLNDAHWHMSGEVILMTLVGGMGTLLGPVVGATFVVNIEYQLSQGPLRDWVNPILGGIFVLTVLAFRSGIVGEIQKFLKKNLG